MREEKNPPRFYVYRHQVRCYPLNLTPYKLPAPIEQGMIGVMLKSDKWDNILCSMYEHINMLHFNNNNCLLILNLIIRKCLFI